MKKISFHEKEKMHTIKVKKLFPNAVLPRFGNSEAAGADLVVVRKIENISSRIVKFGTGIAVQPPAGYYFDVVPRSSFTTSKAPGWRFGNSVGVIDQDYRGEIIVVLVWDGEGEPVEPSLPASLFQLLLRRQEQCVFTEVDELSTTERGAGGFGSTDTPAVSTNTGSVEAPIPLLDAVVQAPPHTLSPPPLVKSPKRGEECCSQQDCCESKTCPAQLSLGEAVSAVAQAVAGMGEALSETALLIEEAVDYSRCVGGVCSISLNSEGLDTVCATLTLGREGTLQQQTTTSQKEAPIEGSSTEVPTPPTPPPSPHPELM